ncbi:AMP-dependent synthetase/ligase [Isoptericola sp. NPDC056573]|uniref:AMP-dependent synthetase/ligase n=1 Tax=Isoptericola sp. NPDC056573 TaxID=3345868 RepID=UPI00368AA6A7
MTVATTPSLVDVPEGTSISTLLADRVARTGDRTLIERRTASDGSWVPVSAGEFQADVMTVARGLVAHGIEPGDRVAIMSRTRYEWTLLDFAAWATGAVVVPVYETSSPDQVRWILEDSGARLVVVETPAHADAVRQVDDELPDLEEVLVIATGAVDELREAGASVPARDVAARRDAVRRDDLATIVYTSGSTGRPKGAELTHGNFAHLAMNARLALPELLDSDGARTVLFLPLAHVFARLIQVAVIASGSVLGHLPDVKTLTDDLRTFRPTFLLAVPRVFEKVYNSAEQRAASRTQRQVFGWAARVSGQYSRALDTGRVPVTLRARHALADRLVLSRLRTAMGGNLRYAISGGAPLGDRLGHFFRGAGLTVLEGYGLTETTAPTAVNLPSDLRIGTVGPPFPGTSVRIDDDGAVFVAGPHLFRGYRGRPDLTADAMTDGWFRTGDLGALDQGHLRITGRTKEIIVTAGGKNVAPAPLEDRVRAHPLVSQVVVVGDKRPFIGALVTLDAEMLPGWLATQGMAPMSVGAARTDPRVLAALDAAVEEANTAVSRAESIRKFRVLEGDFTEANEYLTPSLKVKRDLVLRDFADEVDALYAG